MKTFIRNLTVEKQVSSQWCWVAASFAVIRYYRFVVYDQYAVASQLGVVGNEPGKPSRLLEEYGIFEERVLYDEPNSEIEAQQRASTLFVRIASEISLGRPVIINVKSVGGGGMLTITFSHALVVKGVDDINKTLTLLDPGRPRVELTVSCQTLVSGWYIYEDTANTERDYSDVFVCVRQVIFTKPPHQNSRTVGNVVTSRR